ncbi:MAG: DUF4163 domain-containing protein [Candidatus Nealsonbacteria bacterium]|nr:DUF4163 domain-containing protein [Candidatus Nealsonbacteria bacterium]
MSKNKLAIIIILILLGGWLGWEVRGILMQEAAREASSPENSLAMSVRYIHEKDNFYNIQVEYPQFNKTDSDFNDKISSLIAEKIDSFKKASKENYEARKETAPPDNPVPETPPQPFDFIASWEPSQINDRYISFVIHMYYFVGGAHGANEIYTFNYDVQKKQEITISDFLNSSSSPQALESLAQLANQDVTSQLESRGLQVDDFLKEMIEQGTAAEINNYKNFTFNNNSLTIYFQQYQVAPGAAGSITVVLYRSTLDANSISSNYLR